MAPSGIDDGNGSQYIFGNVSCHERRGIGHVQYGREPEREQRCGGMSCWRIHSEQSAEGARDGSQPRSPVRHSEVARLDR